VNPFDTPWPAAYVSPIPFVVAQGGNVVIIDEKNPGSFLYIDTQAPWDSGFKSALVGAAAQQQGRAGTRFFLWGSQLFQFGGVQQSPNQNITFNDLCVPVRSRPPAPKSSHPQNPIRYVMDLTYTLANPASVQSWTQVSPLAQASGAVAGYPDPRVSPTITPFHHRAFLFGGASRTLLGADPTECFRSLPAPTDCFFHHHVHSLTPSSLPQPFGIPNGMPQYYPNSLSASVWQQLGAGGVNGLPGITGRVQHAAGAMGNQLYVYGGVTAAGPVSELWAYNLVRICARAPPASLLSALLTAPSLFKQFSETWAMVAPSNPSPPLGFSAGEIVGSFFYVYSQPPLGSGTPGSLWRWRPAMASVPSSSGSGYSSALANGHTAGIVIGILIGLGNLYCLFALVGNAGVSLVPEWTGRLPVVGQYFGGGARGAPGFYSSSNAGVNAAGPGGYAPPPDL
jgi:hypothetical protein